MVLVTGNWRLWLAGMVASLVVFGVIFFAAIKPSENTANHAVNAGLHQAQQALNQASTQLKRSSGSHTGGSHAGATAGAQHTLNTAAKLASCISAAGINTTQIQSCHAKYTP